jgi:hypothetical protein
MDTAPQIESICKNVAASVNEVRRVFRSAPPVPEILNRYWGLQDNLSRLLEAMTDHPIASLEALEGFPNLLKDVVDVLAFSSKLQMLKNIPAVREAGDAINNSLLEIQYLKQARTLTATA